MRRRLFWLLAGWAAGLTTWAWLQRKLHGAVRRYTPEHVRRDLARRGSDAVRRVRRFGDDLAAASRDGRSEAHETRTRLRHEYASHRHHR